MYVQRNLGGNSEKFSLAGVEFYIDYDLKITIIPNEKIFLLKITDSSQQQQNKQQQQIPPINSPQLNRQLRSTSCRIPNTTKAPPETLKVQIPQQQQQTSSNNSSPQTSTTNTIYYHSYGLNAAQQGDFWT